MTVSALGPDMHRVLCVRLDNMGDVLMTTPAIHALRSALPHSHIALLTSRSAAQLAPYLEDVDEVIAYDAPWVKKDTHASEDDFAILERLQAARYDMAVIFTVYSQSPLPAALMCRMAGIQRVRAHCRENPYSLLSDWVREVEPGPVIRHEAQRQLDLLAPIVGEPTDTRLRFNTQQADQRRMKALLKRAGVAEGAGWMVAHCGATAESRRYPPEKFSQVFDLLGSGAGPIVLTGDASERELVRAIKRGCKGAARLVDMTGQLSLGELACLIQQADVLLTNNTGPAHLAAALGTPVVDLYALTNPQHTPWQVAQRVLYYDVPCKWCYRSVCPEGHHLCLRGVSPEQVHSAVIELLEERRNQARGELAGVA